MNLPIKEGTASRVLTETLKLSKDGNRVELEDIALNAKTTESFARQVLTSVIGDVNTRISLKPGLRIQVALEIARAGRLKEAAQVLTWQEFENFAERCLEEAAFRTQKNVRIKGDGRVWQIDVVGFRGELVLAIDCKHWNTPSSLSRFKPVANHQRIATLHLLPRLREKMIRRDNEPHALPMILTLSEPPAQFVESAVLLSVEKLPNFLSGVTPYDENLPFIPSLASVVENPMSQSN
ncbi:restriction endonuclease [Candidatus Bathyarchaeota archaeon]|nr:MAG: restriction endonuclease [Candidatus Bathyarchaeota archaeon]